MDFNLVVWLFVINDFCIYMSIFWLLISYNIENFKNNVFCLLEYEIFYLCVCFMK